MKNETELPEGWQIKNISHVLERASEPVKPEAEATYREIGIRSHGKGIFHKQPVTGKDLGNKRVFNVIPNCFVVNIVFAWEQAVAKTTKAEEGMIASHRFPQFKPRNNQCDIDYILYLFKTHYGKYLLGLASPGGAGRNKTLGQKEFERIKISLPPLEEQSRIAQIILTWDKAIATVDASIDNAQKQKKALMQKLLTGEKRLPGLSVKWKDRKLIEFAKIIVSPVDKKCEEDEIPVKLCNYTDVYYNTHITCGISFMEATAKQSEIDKYVLQVNDVVITKDSESPEDIARSALISEDLNGVICGYHLAIIRPNEKVASGAFLNQLFSMPMVRYYFFTLANGATRFGLSVGGIRKASFCLPPIKEQKEIAKVLSNSDQHIEILSLKMKYLKEEKRALIQQLLTGKRRVSV